MDEALRQHLMTEFPAIANADIELDPDGVVVPVDDHVRLAETLKVAGYTLYITVVASHWPAIEETEKEPGRPEYFEVATVLRRPVQGASPIFKWRVRLDPDQEIPSLFSLFAGADWQEREQFDLVGVRFSDHPDLRRLMLPEDWEGHPLRKDYAIDTSHAPWR